MPIREKTINSINELMDAAGESMRLLDTRSALFFRGQSTDNPEWKLRPRIYRGTYDAWAENVMIGEFQREAISRQTRCPAPGDTSAWLSLMQHYGLPTRLLDWSTSVGVAAYFAVCHEMREGPCVIWVLSPEHLNKCSGDDPGRVPHLGSPLAMKQFPYVLRRHLFPKNEGMEQHVVACAGAEVDARLMLQQSVFTVHGPEIPLEESAGSERFLLRLMVTPGGRTEIAKGLGLLGIRRSYLFPDLANLAQCIEERWRGSGATPAPTEQPVTGGDPI